MSEDKSMDPVSGEVAEVDGIYETEWGREQKLKRGDVFPADVALGHTEWRMVSYELDDAQKGETQQGKFGRKMEQEDNDQHVNDVNRPNN